MCIIFERIGICVVPFITNMLQKISHGLPYFLICGCAVAAAMFGLILPETKGKPTRECYEEFFRETPSINGKTSEESAVNACNNITVDDEAV